MAVKSVALKAVEMAAWSVVTKAGKLAELTVEQMADKMDVCWAG